MNDIILQQTLDFPNSSILTGDRWDAHQKAKVSWRNPSIDRP